MMIPKYLKRLCCLLVGAAAGLLGSVPQAHAALPAGESDIFLCFRATAGLGANTDYLVNIGPAADFTSATGVKNVSIPGDIAADLEALYGVDWKTRADVVWSVSGVQKVAGNNLPTNTMFASRAEISPGTQSEAWARPSAFGAGAPALKMQAMRDPGYTAGTRDDSSQFESTNSTKALLQSVNAANSYASYMPGGANTTGLSAFGYFNAAGGIEASFENGTAFSVLDFYKLEPGTGPGVLVGGFRLSDSAELTFSTDISFFAGPALVRFEQETYSVSEEVGSGMVTLTIQRTGNADAAFTLNFSTSDGTAVAGTDYVAQTNTPVVFGVGELSKTVDVTVSNRAGFQGDRSFNATLSVAAGAPQLINPSTAVVTILETTPQPSTFAFSAASYNVAENIGSGVAVVTINRTGPSASAATVKLSTQDGSAAGGVDFTSQTGTIVSFASGETSKVVDIAIANRAGFQGNRDFTVVLSEPTNLAELGTPSTATVTILESSANPAGTLAFAAGTFRFAANLSPGQPNTAVITLERSVGATGAVTVDLVLAAGGTLVAGEDFTFTSPTTVSFAAGQLSATVEIPLTSNASPVPGTFMLQLSNATGGASIGTPASATVSITAPDSILPKLKVTSPKGGKSNATFDVAGTVQDADDIDRVEVRLNDGAPQFATLGTKSGTGTSFSLAGVSAENGPNTLLVQAFDINGTPSKIVRVKFNYVNVRPELTGIYTGLITPTGATPPGGDANNASGLLTVKIAPTGAFSGKILIGGATLPIGGVLANDQTARFKTAFGSTLALASKGKTPVVFGDLSLAVAAGKMTGAIGTVAVIDADRAAFDGKSPATTPDAEYLANKGRYTSVLPSKAQAALPATLFPQGDGIGNITVTKQGKVTFKGRLADGTPVSMSAPLSSELKAPFFAALYLKKGSIAGSIVLDNSEADSDLSGEDFLWLRPAQSNAKHYPAGWPEGVKLDLVGASYAVSSGSSALPDLDPEDADGNAMFQAEDGELTGGTFIKDVNISTKNKVTNVPSADKTFKMAISAAKGAISGFFPHTDGTKTKFNGIILQKGANRGGFGYFLSTVAKNGPAGEAGGISLSKK